MVRRARLDFRSLAGWRWQDGASTWRIRTTSAGAGSIWLRWRGTRWKWTRGAAHTNERGGVPPHVKASTMAIAPLAAPSDGRVHDNGHRHELWLRPRQ